MKEDDKNKLETDFIIEQSLNLYVIYKLFKEKLINETEYYYLVSIYRHAKEQVIFHLFFSFNNSANVYGLPITNLFKQSYSFLPYNLQVSI